MHKCKEGEYFCNDEQKCKPIPKGTKVRADGELVPEGYDAGDFNTLKDKIGSAKKHRKTFKQFMGKD